MKRLLLVRHGKAAPKEAGGQDAPRPLAEEGRREASALGAILRSRGLSPGAILCSGAARARETAGILARELASKAEPAALDELYAADARGVLAAVAAHAGEAECAMVVGHNPAVEEAASLLAGKKIRLDTCWVADFDVSIESWGALAGAPQASLRGLHGP